MHAEDKQNEDDRRIWDSYNFLMECPDTDRIRKLLVRQEYFRMSLDIPGDIVEMGVFKGTGLFQFLKFKQIFCPGSHKKIVGFDTFYSAPSLSGQDEEQMKKLFQGASFTGVDPNYLYGSASKILSTDNVRDYVELVPGDVVSTLPVYCEKNPGFRISLLHLDLDVEEPTNAALEWLWPKVSRGGIIIFDEYGISRWSESNAVDAFFKDKPGCVLKTLSWAKTPTAYLVKP